MNEKRYLHMKNNKPILLVEDDRVDAMTVRRALREVHVTNEVVNVGNGEEALNYLHDESKPKPCIILLDLNMPKMNGIEFLAVAKQDDVIRMIPVIVLTTSRATQDRHESFRMSIAGYMVKPMEYGNFVDKMKTIHNYWTTCELPE